MYKSIYSCNRHFCKIELNADGFEVIQIISLRRGIGSNVGQSDRLNALREQMAGDAQTEIYGLQAQIDELINVHKLTLAEVLGKAMEIDNYVRNYRDAIGNSYLIKILGINPKPIKPQG